MPDGDFATVLPEKCRDLDVESSGVEWARSIRNVLRLALRLSELSGMNDVLSNIVLVWKNLAASRVWWNSKGPSAEV